MGKQVETRIRHTYHAEIGDNGEHGTPFHACESGPALVLLSWSVVQQLPKNL